MRFGLDKIKLTKFDNLEIEIKRPDNPSYVLTKDFGALTDHLDGLRNEKQSDVEKLNFQFSGTIDSVEFLSKKNGSFFFGNTFPMSFNHEMLIFIFK